LNVPKISIKWPNDILSANKKIGGILIENVLEGSFVKYSVIGLGLNVNEIDFPSLPQASSMRLETGKAFQIEEVLDNILKTLFKNLKDISARDFSEMKRIYENNLFRMEKISVFETPDGSRFNGIIKGVSEIGELLLETENETLRKFQMKEVKLIY
jgi:BirA family biotin operon repressor/biotin-[acetyl-CoA-carboxylase] ligase